MSMDYETIKRLKTERGLRSVTDLLVMASNTDPCYYGSPGDWEAARWFKGVWDKFGYHTAGLPVHLRRIHYRLVSQESPIELWFDHQPYINTKTCWDNLGKASRAARYLGLVPFDGFVDARNPAVEEYDPEASDGPRLVIDQPTSMLFELLMPDLPDLPALGLLGYQGRQRYHVEVWAEKTTMHEILRPLCERYGLWLLAASGQLSTTQIYTAACRIAKDGRPARILYLSDLDPEGLSMPVASARRLEWFQHFAQSPLRDTLAGADIRLDQVAITKQQGEDYHLPRTPLKPSVEKAADKKDWKNLHGEGGLELDALEALYPGVFGTIMVEAIKRYYDATLTGRVWQAYGEATQAIEERGQHGLVEAALRTEARTIDLEDFPIPDGAEAEESDAPLYCSSRDYDEQLAAYKAFQGGRLDSQTP